MKWQFVEKALPKSEIDKSIFKTSQRLVLCIEGFDQPFFGKAFFDMNDNLINFSVEGLDGNQNVIKWMYLPNCNDEIEDVSKEIKQLARKIANQCPMHFEHIDEDESLDIASAISIIIEDRFSTEYPDRVIEDVYQFVNSLMK